MSAVGQPVSTIRPVLAAELGLAEWIGAGAVLVGAVVIVLAIRRVMRMIVTNTTLQEYAGDLIARVMTAIVLIVAALYSLQILEVEIGPLLGGLTIFAFIIAYSLQPIIGNLIAAVTLNSSRSIRPGDQIETNEVEGTVIDIHARSTEILTFDGVTAFVPNLNVLGSTVINRTADFERRSTIDFHVNVDVNLRDAQRIVVGALRELDGVAEMPRADVIVLGFDDAGVVMQARFWHGSEHLTAQWVVSEAAIAIKESLEAADIPLSYPKRINRPPGGPDASGQPG